MRDHDHLTAFQKEKSTLRARAEAANKLLERTVNIAIAAHHRQKRDHHLENPADRCGATCHSRRAVDARSIFATTAFARRGQPSPCATAPRVLPPWADQKYTTLYYTADAVLDALNSPDFQCNHRPASTRSAGGRGSSELSPAAPLPLEAQRAARRRIHDRAHRRHRRGGPTTAAATSRSRLSSLRASPLPDGADAEDRWQPDAARPGQLRRGVRNRPSLGLGCAVRDHGRTEPRVRACDQNRLHRRGAPLATAWHHTSDVQPSRHQCRRQYDMVGLSDLISTARFAFCSTRYSWRPTRWQRKEQAALGHSTPGRGPVCGCLSDRKEIPPGTRGILPASHVRCHR